MDDEVLVKVEGVSKKFCRSLKRSLWYGVQDVAADMFGRRGSHDELRNNEFWAVNDVSFELKRGECLGLIGPNGAGKSTLLKMLNGLVKPDKGRITMRGQVGALIELGAGFNPILTARENIYVNGSVLGFTKKEIDRKFDAIVDFAEIEEFIDTPVQSFSSGMKVRLGFAVAAQMEPDVLLIDEVLAVGDAGFKARCFTRISAISKRTSVILVSHSMPEVARTASSILLLESGKTAFSGYQVAEGIGEYLDSFESHEHSSSQTDGSRLINVTLLDPSTDERLVAPLRHNDPVAIEIKFELSPKISRCVVTLGIKDGNRQQVLQCSSIKSEFYVRGSAKVQTVKLVIPQLPLSLGTYSLSVYFAEFITDNRRGIICFHSENALAFKVIDQSPGYCPVQIVGRWTQKF